MTDAQPRHIVKVVNNDHKHCLISSLCELWEVNCYTDTKLVGRNQSGFASVSVNKLNLAAVSHKFACLLPETQDEINIIFPDTDIQVLKFFVKFMYSGQILMNSRSISLVLELQTFLSEWNVQYSQTTYEPESAVDKSQNLLPSPEKAVLHKELPDQAGKLEKLFNRTYSRKKKVLKPLIRLEVVPELNITTKEKPIDLESNFITQVITYDCSNAAHTEAYEDMNETIPEDICDIFINAKNLREEEKRNKELLSLLRTLTEKTRRYKVYAKHIIDGGRRPSNSAEVSKRKYIPCTTCGKEIHRDYMATHEKIHAGERPYLCELCGATFLLPDRLRNHLKFIHDKSRLPLHACKTCGKSFKKASYLRNHETLHSGVKPHKCPYCDKSFRLLAVLSKHKRVHTGEKPYECEVCHKRFSARTNYVVHLRTHRNVSVTSNNSDETNSAGNGTTYKCNICGTIFHRDYIYLTHMAAHKGEEPKLPCRHCFETFATYKLVKNHLREKHADTLLICEQCPKFFTTQTALKNHRALHKEGKQQRCLICVRTFPSKEALEVHKRSFHVNDVPLKCNVCNKVFKSVMTLRIHRRVHTDERPYQCIYCPKAFRQDTHLANHIRIHTGEKPFSCTVCGKAFRMGNNLRVHMKIHTGQKIQCKHCGKVFRSFVKLKEHQNTHPTQDGSSCVSPMSASTSSESNS